MTPVLLLGMGLFILWCIFTGRALAMWNAATQPGTGAKGAGLRG